MCSYELRRIKATFSFHKLIPKNAQMTTLYTNVSVYITFTMIYYIRQELFTFYICLTVIGNDQNCPLVVMVMWFA